jgi:hypothetical protein
MTCVRKSEESSKLTTKTQTFKNEESQ